MLHLLGLAILATLAAHTNAACDLSALNNCVSSATPDGNTAEGNPCLQYNAIMMCITKYNATCSNEVKSYTGSLAPLVAMCGGGGGSTGGAQPGGSCDMQAVGGCMAIMEGFQGALSGDTPPTGADLKQACDGFKAFETCINNLPAECESVMAGNKAMIDQMGSTVSQYCGGDGCDIMGVQMCVAPLQGMDLMDDKSMMSSLVEVSSKCAQMEGVINCIQPKLEGCQENELVNNMTASLNKGDMYFKFVCSEKMQDIMELAACAGKPAALQKLRECESKHPMPSDPSTVAKEQLCTDVNTMTGCLETATNGVCSEDETSKMVNLYKDAMKMMLKGEDPCDVSGAGTLMSSLWSSLALVVMTMLL